MFHSLLWFRWNKYRVRVDSGGDTSFRPSLCNPGHCRPRLGRLGGRYGFGLLWIGCGIHCCGLAFEQTYWVQLVFHSQKI